MSPQVPGDTQKSMLFHQYSGSLGFANNKGADQHKICDLLIGKYHI